MFAFTCAVAIASRIRNTSAALSSTTRMTGSRPAASSSDGDGEPEGRSEPRFGFHPDPAVIEVDDSLTDGQANAGTGILIAGMQTFEEAKNSLLILRLNADSVVADGEDPVSVMPVRANVDGRRALRAAVFDRVADQILKNLLQVRGAHGNEWQWIIAYVGASLVNNPRKVLPRRSQRLIGVGDLGGFVESRHLRIGEQIAHQRLHARRAATQIFQELQRLALQPVAIP